MSSKEPGSDKVLLAEVVLKMINDLGFKNFIRQTLIHDD